MLYDNLNDDTISTQADSDNDYVHEHDRYLQQQQTSLWQS